MMTQTKVAILALQGAFAEHEQMLQSLGVESMQIRNINDWHKYIETSEREHWEPSLILPGGESTAMMKIMNDEQLTDPIRESILKGMPVLGTCAGMILLDDKHLAVMDITVKRNAYGRQLGSFNVDHDFKGLGEIPMTFIRAPYIERCGEGVDILSELDGHIVAARQRRMIACSFHPELTNDTRVHEFWLSSFFKRNV